MAPRKPKPKPPSYSWISIARHVYCFTSPKNNCAVSPTLWEGRRSDFHDAELQNATDEINKIIDRVERDNEDSSRHLCFIDFQGRLMLVWTQHGEVISSDDADDEIAKALKIKGFNQR